MHSLIRIGVEYFRNSLRTVRVTKDEFEGKNEELERSLVRNTHVHLPKLDDAGFVDWNREDSTVTRGLRFEEILARP